MTADETSIAATPSPAYGVRLIVGNDTLSRRFSVAADPRVTSTTAELVAQYAASQRVIDRLKATVETQADTISRHLSYMTVDEFFALKHIYPASGDNQSLGRRASTICKNTSREKRTQKRYAPNIQSVVEIGEYPVDVLEQAYDDMVTAGRIPMNIPQIALQIRA